jgi:GDPmannose 4,6-dehydratase
MKNRCAVIFGVGGQDGFYLSELLLKSNYKVYGTVHRKNAQIESELLNLGIKVLECDVNDFLKVANILSEIKPNEIYNLAGKSSVGASWDDPTSYMQTNALAVINMLDILINPKFKLQKSRFFQASTSEMFGDTGVTPATETHSILPTSPYAASKALSHHLIQVYKDSYGCFAISGILFNHESPRRKENFLSKKICTGAVGIVRGHSKKIVLGNLENRRDWSYAGDTMKAAWLAMQQETPSNFIIGRGESKTISQFVQTTFECLGIVDWQKYIELDEKLLRRGDVRVSEANPNKAFSQLGWEPKFNFEQLIDLLVKFELST